MFPYVSFGSLPDYRKQYFSAWSCFRGGPCSRGARCRTTIWPEESTWGQVESHPGLNRSQPPIFTSTRLWTHIFSFFSNKEPNSFVCITGILMLHRQHSPTHPQVHCFDTSFLEVVLYCFYCLFILTEALYVFVCVRFKICLCPCKALDLQKKGYKDHISHQPMIHRP